MTISLLLYGTLIVPAMTMVMVIGTLLLVGLVSPTIVAATVDPLVVDLARQFPWETPDPPINDLASFALRTADSLLSQGSGGG